MKSNPGYSKNQVRLLACLNEAEQVWNTWNDDRKKENQPPAQQNTAHILMLARELFRAGNEHSPTLAELTRQHHAQKNPA